MPSLTSRITCLRTAFASRKQTYSIPGDNDDGSQAEFLGLIQQGGRRDGERQDRITFGRCIVYTHGFNGSRFGFSCKIDGVS